jgi:hypothetical protein
MLLKKNNRHTDMNLAANTDDMEDMMITSLDSNALKHLPNHNIDKEFDNEDINAFDDLPRSQSHTLGISNSSSGTSSPLKKGENTFNSRTKDFRLNLKGKSLISTTLIISMAQ